MSTYQPQSDALRIATIAAKAADEKQATDVTVLDVGEILAITDLFVVASAGNKRQVRTISDAITDAVRSETGRSPLSSEGVSEQQWILIDYGSVVVHIFDDETRRFYEIERLYQDVPSVSWRLVS
ncbi:MAG: ribosome silencing factor [Ilumatobacteraceae bacterium]|nr:ribosome silencing factor [Ilumatobacteraceae bacterium]